MFMLYVPCARAWIQGGLSKTSLQRLAPNLAFRGCGKLSGKEGVLVMALNSPLLGVDDDPLLGDDIKAYAHDHAPRVPVNTREELSKLASLSWPIGLSSFSRVGMGITDLAMIGRLIGTDGLAGASVANIWMLTSAAFLGRGFSSATQVLCAQAFGARNYNLVGEWLLIGVVTVFLAHLPICVLWWNTDKIVSLFVDNVEVQRLATEFARWSILGLGCQILYMTVESYFQAIKVVRPALYVNAGFLFVNALMNWVLINGCGGALWGWEGLGFIGSPIGTVICRFLLLLTYWGYSVWYQRYHMEPHACWPKNGVGFGNWKHIFTRPRLKLFLVGQVLPLAIACNLEEWQLQVVAVFAATLGDVAIATHNTTINIFFCMSVLILAIMQAASVLIGGHLGALNHEHAKAVMWLTYKVCATVGLVLGAIIVTLRHELGQIFSDDPEVIDLTASILLLSGGCFFFLSIFYASMAVLDGQARPNAVAVSFFIGAWLVCAPLSYVFAFTLDLGLLGLWYGLTAGYSVVTLCSLGFIAKSDWPALAQLAFARAERNVDSVLEKDSQLPRDARVSWKQDSSPSIN